ncbi:hypothetical protein TURU_082916 [Turdus rufiventris]|nr:hypothetical protein TURU_082916 [Turdus rufiventris]
MIFIKKSIGYNLNAYYQSVVCVSLMSLQKVHLKTEEKNYVTWTVEAPSAVCDDSKLCGAEDSLEGRDAIAIQSDLGRLERWHCANLVELNKAKSKVLHLGQGNPKHTYRLIRDWIKSSFEEKNLGVLEYWLRRNSG